MGNVSREQFVEHVLGVIKNRFPLVKASRAEESFSLRINGNVASLENLYRSAALAGGDIQHGIERWVVELIRAAEGAPDADAPFEELEDRILPMVLRAVENNPIDSMMVLEPLVDGLNIGYAIDNDRTIAYISQTTLNKWSVSRERLHEAAIKNLVARSEAIAAHAAQDEDGSISLIMFETRDGYDASRVLLPTLHERLREYLGSPFVAAIPNRDILLCFRNTDDTVTRLREKIQEDFRSRPHQVTDQLLLVTADGLAPHD
jgi:uncharacterized protein YtpQ (UPF0354 family)